MKEIKLEEVNNIPIDLIKDDISQAIEVTQTVIKPYTESQLSALYHNSELDTLDVFMNQYVDAELKGKFNIIYLFINGYSIFT